MPIFLKMAFNLLQSLVSGPEIDLQRSESASPVDDNEGSSDESDIEHGDNDVPDDRSSQSGDIDNRHNGSGESGSESDDDLYKTVIFMFNIFCETCA